MGVSHFVSQMLDPVSLEIAWTEEWCLNSMIIIVPHSENAQLFIIVLVRIKSKKAANSLKIKSQRNQLHKPID